MSEPPRFLVAGEALFDVFVGGESGGETAMAARPGGSPFNVAIGLARLGSPAAFLGGVSTDPLGERLVAALVREGVDVSLVRRLPRRTTLALVALSPAGVPAYSFYGAGSADAALSPADLPELPDSIAAIHVGSYAAVIRPIGAAVAALVARERGRRLIAYDPNVRPTIEPDLDLWRETVTRLAGMAHIVKLSVEDFERLWPGESPEKRAAEWLGRGARLVALTRGDGGATAWAPCGGVDVPAAPVRVVDTIGAGDSFQAALLAALDRRGGGDPGAALPTDTGWLETLVGFASRAAAMTCGRRGADMPRLAELDPAAVPPPPLAAP